jgi:hypothetical protein
MIVTFYCIAVFLLSGNEAFFIHHARQSRHSIYQSTSTTDEKVEARAALEQQVTLKVPAAAWRFPPVWPFQDDSFAPYLGEFKGNKVDEKSVQFIDFFEKSREQLGPDVLVVGAPESSVEKIASLGWRMENSFDVLDTYPSRSYDAILVVMGIDSVVQPRKEFNKLWRLLKPNASLYGCFIGGNGNGATKPIKLWTTTNDEQKMWVVGAYCHYAAPTGWVTVEGFDITGTSGDKEMVFSKDTDLTAFTVRAKKINFDELDFTLETDTIIGRVAQRLSLVFELDVFERKLLAIRFANAYKGSSLSEDELDEKMRRLVAIYGIINEVKETVIPRAAKATLAFLLIDTWNGAESQQEALKMAVGLAPPNDFWRSVGKATIKMEAKDKIFFLADVISCFGRNAELQEQVMTVFPSLLDEVITEIKARLPEASDARVQGFATDLLVSDVVKKQFGGREKKVLPFVKSLSNAKLQELVLKK